MRGVFVYERYWVSIKGIWDWSRPLHKDKLGNLGTIHKDIRAIHKDNLKHLLIKKTEP